MNSGFYLGILVQASDQAVRKWIIVVPLEKLIWGSDFLDIHALPWALEAANFETQAQCEGVASKLCSRLIRGRLTSYSVTDTESEDQDSRQSEMLAYESCKKAGQWGAEM